MSYAPEKEERHSGPEIRSPLSPADGDRRLNGVPQRIETLLTTKEASQILKIHPKVLERMAKRGVVPALKVGKF